MMVGRGRWHERGSTMMVGIGGVGPAVVGL